MRLWSLHPRYLDAAGLTACWREGLLARSVLAGKTIGYRRHPQLERFRACADPLTAIDTYLAAVRAEACRRGYGFDAAKIGPGDATLRLTVTQEQLAYEFAHLRAKMKRRCPSRFAALAAEERIEPHPLFTSVPGGIEPWERL